MNNDLNLRLKPIPASFAGADDDSYKECVIDTESPEHNEPLVELAQVGVRGVSFYHQQDGLNAPLYAPFHSAMKGVYVRTSVGRKLLEVNELLSKYGLRLLVLDGFRPIAVQAELWQWMLSQAQALLPHDGPAEWEAFALRYASNPTNFDVNDSRTWPTHSTGGAVDVTLEEIRTGQVAYMGGIYLDCSEVSSTRYYETSNDISASHTEANRNRRLLYWAMQLVGFVNYAFEWWHFDYLTQASVMNRGMPSNEKAHYGLANRGLTLE